MEIIGITFINGIELAGSVRTLWIKEHNPEVSVELLSNGFVKIKDKKPFPRLIPVSNVKDITINEAKKGKE
jgi:hypothetical protein